MGGQKIQSTTDAGSLNTLGRNENRSCAYFIGTSSHCVFSNTIQNLPCSGPRTRSRWGIRTGMRTRARLLKYHAEVVAHRTGEPFGTLVLAVAVTIMEVALDRLGHGGSSSGKGRF